MTNYLKIAFLAVGLGLSTSAVAQSPNMSCADYLKLEEQMAGQLTTEAKAALQADASAADMDKKIKAYCVANPKASALEATEKALLP